MSVTTRNMTADELFMMSNDRGHRYELVAGALKVMEPAGLEHGAITALLTERLTQYARANRVGRVFTADAGFKIARDPDTVRAPDVAFISRERIDKAGIPKGFWEGAPDLAVEVISPNDTFTEVEEKVISWLAAGTKMVIVLNPRTHSATVYRPNRVTRLSDADVIDGEDVVPGWSVAINDLFE